MTDPVLFPPASSATVEDTFDLLEPILLTRAPGRRAPEAPKNEDLHCRRARGGLGVPLAVGRYSECVAERWQAQQGGNCEEKASMLHLNAPVIGTLSDRRCCT